VTTITKVLGAMYTPEKLKEFQAMDEVAYQYFFKNGVQPEWTEELWREFRTYQMHRNGEESKRLDLA
jgi:hypothetical protein